MKLLLTNEKFADRELTLEEIPYMVSVQARVEGGFDTDFKTIYLNDVTITQVTFYTSSGCFCTFPASIFHALWKQRLAERLYDEAHEKLTTAYFSYKANQADRQYDAYRDSQVEDLR